MNSDRTAGQWKQIKGSIKEQWGKLTDDDLTRLEGRLQERYGLAREEAERQAREFRTRHNWH